MTYANGQPQGLTRTPQQPTRNSLDYWNKSEDWQGVTTYYRGRSPYGMENVYAQTPRIQRPAPFPLNLPVTKPQEGRRLPSPRSPSAPETGAYQNVPVVPRVRMPEREKKPSPPKDSPIFSAKAGPDSLIWSVSSHTHHHHNNHVAPINNSPQITRVEVRPSGNPEKHRSPRSKPKWGRFMRTLCCCVAPDGKTDKQTFAPPLNPSQPITQVQKNGYPELPQYQQNRPVAPATEAKGKGDNADYTPSPPPATQLTPLPKVRFIVRKA